MRLTPSGAPWPVTLSGPAVTLRPLRRADEKTWMAVRLANGAWLDPWEATDPGGGTTSRLSFPSYVRALKREARAGRSFPWIMEVDGGLVGQMTVSSIVRGSLQSGSIGYWIDQRWAGRGLTPTAVAMAIDYCLGPAGLHRVEIAIRPQNAASLRVVEKLGLREEGMRLRFLHIAGAWADHRCFAITAEEMTDDLKDRWRRATHWTGGGESQ